MAHASLIGGINFTVEYDSYTDMITLSWVYNTDTYSACISHQYYRNLLSNNDSAEVWAFIADYVS